MFLPFPAKFNFLLSTNSAKFSSNQNVFPRGVIYIQYAPVLMYFVRIVDRRAS